MSQDKKPREFYVRQEDYSNRALVRDGSEKWPDDVNGKPSSAWTHVIEKSAYDELQAKLAACEAELAAWNEISKVSGRSRAEIYGMSHQLKAGKYGPKPRHIPSCDCSNPDNLKIHDEICDILEENAWNEDAVCTASVGIWAALKWYEKERECNKVLREVCQNAKSALSNPEELCGDAVALRYIDEALAKEKEMRK